MDLKILDPAGPLPGLPRAGIPDQGFGIDGSPKWGHWPFPLCSVPSGPGGMLAWDAGCLFPLAILFAF